MSESCEWTYADDEGMWITGCEELHIFSSDGPVENAHRFCPYCGKPLVIKGDENAR